MTHQELLEAYIKPAIDNNCLIEGQKITGYRWGANSSGALTISTEDNEYSLMPLEILFNHVFASAFFGSELINDRLEDVTVIFSEKGIKHCYDVTVTGMVPKWRTCLIALILMSPENHYKYLTKFIEDDK